MAYSSKQSVELAENRQLVRVLSFRTISSECNVILIPYTNLTILIENPMGKHLHSCFNWHLYLTPEVSINSCFDLYSSPIQHVLLAYRIHGLIAKCIRLFLKLQGNMHLIPYMRLIMQDKKYLTTLPKLRCLGSMCT